MIDYTLHTDVLVIGAGAAGIRSAIAAADAGADVLVVTKKRFGTSGSTFYPGTIGWGMNAVIHEGDTPEYYLEEILDAGANAADPELARILAQQSTDRFHDLESYGLEFSKDDRGKYNGVIPCFGKRKRGSTTIGIDKIRNALWIQLMKRGVRVRDHVTVMKLIVDSGRCIGAAVIDEHDRIALVHAGAVVIACGGACDLFSFSLATPDQTGDGYMLAAEAGARLVNLEFIQFIPGLTHPVKKLLFMEKNLDAFPKVTNRHGEEFLDGYLPVGISREECLTERAKHGPFSTASCSSFFDIAMHDQWIRGNALDSGGLHLQYPQSILKDQRWFITAWLTWMQEKSIDVVKEGFDMIPHAQGFNGGIFIDKSGGTDIEGMFAAGETAGGPHGADRLGGAAIAAAQVFGALAGSSAAAWASGHPVQKIVSGDIDPFDDLRIWSNHGDQSDVSELRSRIGNIMWESASIVRSEQQCRKGIRDLMELRECWSPFKQFYEQKKGTIDCMRRIELAQLVLTAIDSRRESRGPHYRKDYPGKDGACSGMSAVYKNGEHYDCKLIRTADQ